MILSFDDFTLSFDDFTVLMILGHFNDLISSMCSDVDWSEYALSLGY
jgi:hypothetical protein